MSPWDGLNRRRFPRVHYPCQIIVRNENDQKDIFLAHTENVGIGGVCVIFKKGLSMFLPVEVEIDLMDLEDNLRCQGKVVWSVRRKSSEPDKPLFYDIGIEFVNISESYHSRLEATIQRLVKHGHIVPET